jgi:hypothetical protein
MAVFTTMIYSAGAFGEAVEICKEEHKTVRLLAGFHKPEVWTVVLKTLKGTSGSLMKRIASSPAASQLVESFKQKGILNEIEFTPSAGSLYVIHPGTPIDFPCGTGTECAKHSTLLIFPEFGPRFGNQGLLPNSPDITRVIQLRGCEPPKRAHLFGNTVTCNGGRIGDRPSWHRDFSPTTALGRAVLCLSDYTQTDVQEDLSVLFPQRLVDTVGTFFRDRFIEKTREDTVQQLEAWLLKEKTLASLQ